MVSLIDEHRSQYGVESICKQSPMAPSVYYEAKARQADPARLPAGVRRDCALREKIQRVHRANFGVCGARKVNDRLNPPRTCRFATRSG
jgi:hypothetical protein